jgi:molecular chaperone GrpE (heat shock protein)
MTDKDLQEKLKQAQKEHKQKADSKKEHDLQIEIEKLQKNYQEQTEIAAKAQRDYINLKLDFDRYQNQVSEREKEQDTNSLISSVKKFLPFIEDLRKSLDNIPQDKKSDPLAQ